MHRFSSPEPHHCGNRPQLNYTPWQETGFTQVTPHSGIYFQGNIPNLPRISPTRSPGPGGYPLPAALTTGSAYRGQPPQCFPRGGRGFKRHGSENHCQWAKKPKVDKRDLPENNRYFCETCDRGFKEEAKYKEHVNEHATCHVKGCSYTAAPKLVRLHFQWQHASGLAEKIWTAYSKEEIEKWRSERKRNFPTAANIANKKAKQQDKFDRGEVLETKSFGKMRGRGRGRNRNRKRNNQHPVQQQQQQQSEVSVHPVQQQQQQQKQQQQNAVTQAKENIPNEHNYDIKSPATSSDFDPLAVLLKDEDSDTEVQQVAPKPSILTGLTGGLGSLMSSYGEYSDSEGESQPAETVTNSPVPHPKTAIITDPQESKAVEKEGSRGVGAAPTLHSKMKRNNRKQNRRQSHNRRQLVPKKQLTLLEKLLAPDIRHERNVLLQCVRYIVRSHFLGIRQSNLPVSKHPSSETFVEHKKQSDSVIDAESNCLEFEIKEDVTRTKEAIDSQFAEVDDEVWEDGQV